MGIVSQPVFCISVSCFDQFDKPPGRPNKFKKKEGFL